MHVVVRPLYYEDIQVRDSYRSPGRTVTEADVAAFAGLSGDLTELHPNAAEMREHVYGGRIAHGLLGLAIQSGLATRVVPPLAHRRLRRNHELAVRGAYISL